MTDEQVGNVRDLTRKAGITSTTTRLSPGHPLLVELAPGQRSFAIPAMSAAPQPAHRGRQRGGQHSGYKPRQARAASTEPAPATTAKATRTTPRRRTTNATGQPTRPSNAAAFSTGSRVGARHR